MTDPEYEKQKKLKNKRWLIMDTFMRDHVVETHLLEKSKSSFSRFRT